MYLEVACVWIAMVGVSKWSLSIYILSVRKIGPLLKLLAKIRPFDIPHGDLLTVTSGDTCSPLLLPIRHLHVPSNISIGLEFNGIDIATVLIFNNYVLCFVRL